MFVRVLNCSLVLDCFVTTWTITHQVPLSMEVSRQEYWSGLPFLTPIFMFICEQSHYLFQKFSNLFCFPSVFSSVAQSCTILCDLMDCSTPGLPVHHQLPELAHTHVHRIGDAIQPSHSLSFPSPSAFTLSQHQGLFQRITSVHQVAKVLEFQLQHQFFQ